MARICVHAVGEGTNRKMSNPVEGASSGLSRKYFDTCITSFLLELIKNNLEQLASCERRKVMRCPKCQGEGKTVKAFRQTGYDKVVVACAVCKGTGNKPYYTPPAS